MKTTSVSIQTNIVNDYVVITVDKSTAVALENAFRVLNSFTAKCDNSRMAEFVLRLRDVIAKFKS
jgi:hypothetical protein